MNYDYSFAQDSYYCYPNSGILRNKLNITDEKALQDAEREITSLKLASFSVAPIVGDFDLAHLKSIHLKMFEDLYEWAGKLRTVDISKGNLFCLSMHLDDYAEGIFSELRKENYLISTPPDKIIERLSYYLSEINVLHPFREGNGRAQRVFLEFLGKIAGYEIDFTDVTSEEMIIASVDSFNKDYRSMEKMMKRISQTITFDEQESFVKMIFRKKGHLLSCFNQIHKK